ncbi:MAG: RluA family pseudouridine synthase [Vicinamibacterales bacterium]
MPEWIVAADAAGVRLDKFLAAPGRLGSRARAAAALERGKIFVNDEEASLRDAARPVAGGDTIRLWEDRPGSSRPAARQPRGDLAIVYEDAAILVFNKPAGLLSVPLDGAHSAVDLLEDYLRSRTRRKPLVVHRIDRDTSGLVVFAKDLRSHAALKEQFRRREPERIYWAAVYGHPEPASGTWRDYLVWDAKALIQKETSPRDPKAAEAIADYRVLESFRDTSLIEVSLQTGKRNQIRIQARLRGHTLIGEQRYVYGPPELRPIAFPRQALHARRLAFDHPADGRRMEFEAPLPADFAELLAKLRRT